MTDHFNEHYRVLDLAPGASWNELRAAYRTKVRAWHPDRFQGDAAAKQLAEDRTKSINLAYKQLAKYFRAHGTLPVDSRPAPIDPPRHTQPETPPADSPYSEPPAPAASAMRHTLHRSRGEVFIVIGLVVSIYLIVQNTAVDPPHPVIAPTSTTAVHAPDEPFFALGSTIGDVYSIQGIPTRTDKNVWYYGASKIYFANGIVVHWDQTSEHPLKARHSAPLTHTASALVFQEGSTKTEVRRLQGDPLRESDKVWEYGVSRIYFEQDRVVSWYESPLDPLKVKRKP